MVIFYFIWKEGKTVQTILKMTDIDKRFSGVQALDKARLDLRRGEVHALMGENGAGKSTLMKVLCGIHSPDGGSIELFGRQEHFSGIRQAQAAGISIIHQELNMMNHLTVAQNIFIGREPVKNGFIQDKKMQEDAAELFERIGVSIDPSARLGSLTVGKQQMVEISKAISFDAGILILDEPTAALTHSEVEELFKIMKDLKKKGIGMIYISHRMDEINRISDRITVMRDGQTVGTLNTADTTKDEIVSMMVGRVVYGDKKHHSTCPKDSPEVLRVEGLSVPGTVKELSFSLKKGEILGFAGLMGAGRTEAARAIYGADRKSEGKITVNGVEREITSPAEAVRCGICYLSEDRKRYGLMLDKSVKDNTVISSLGRFVRNGFILDSAARSASEEVNKRLRTKTPSVATPVRNLSGGNQQKVIIARWLLKDSDIFIFDEPTRGIDIGAKSEIYELINGLAQKGKSVIIISGELAELQRLCDRIIVMCEGRRTAELDIEDATQELIMKYATAREVI